MIRLRRAQKSKEKSSISPLDITVKSATNWAKELAPTWNMVLKHKKGNLTNTEYINLYIQILTAASKHDIISKLVSYGTFTGFITFICYCRNEQFCHTYLLIDYLVENYPEFFERD